MGGVEDVAARLREAWANATPEDRNATLGHWQFAIARVRGEPVLVTESEIKRLGT